MEEGEVFLILQQAAPLVLVPLQGEVVVEEAPLNGKKVKFETLVVQKMLKLTDWGRRRGRRNTTTASTSWGRRGAT